MSAVDRWARKDAQRIHRRVLHLGLSMTSPDRDELAYLRAHALFVLTSPADLPPGWAPDLGELLVILDGIDQRAIEDGSA